MYIVDIPLHCILRNAEPCYMGPGMQGRVNKTCSKLWPPALYLYNDNKENKSSLSHFYESHRHSELETKVRKDFTIMALY